MIGIEALAFFSPDLDKVDGIFRKASQAVERPLDDFDRSHHCSLTKKQVLDAIKKTDAIVDSVRLQCVEGSKMILALKSGTEADIESLQIKENSAENLRSRVAEISLGNKRMLYTFFKAEMHEAWAPHIMHLRYMKTKALQSFEDYQKITTELCELVALYQTQSSDEFSYDLNVMSQSIQSKSVNHPDWVTTGEEFANWIESMRKDA